MTLLKFLEKAMSSAIYRKSLFVHKIRSKRSKSEIVVSIFGSCRQDSLYKSFRVSKIRDGLTYPHYSKEIIQAIRYCLEDPGMVGIDPRVFRNTLIGSTLISKAKIQKEFSRSDYFVIEIASMLEYTDHQSFYFHHIAKEIYPNIEVRRQNFTELKQDLDLIASLIGKDRLVFVSHFSSRKFGIRFELSEFLRNYCDRHGIDFIDPSEMITSWDLNQLVLPEDVISHFSPVGHSIMHDRYREIILRKELIKRDLKSLVQTYTTNPINGVTHGLGDFIYGSFRVHQESTSRGRLANIDVSGHPISQFVEHESIFGDTEIIPIMAEADSYLFQKAERIFTHLRPLEHISIENRDFVLRKCLTPNLRMQEFLNELNEVNYLGPGKFDVLHIRCGDTFMQENFPRNLLDDLYQKIDNAIESLNIKSGTLLVTDFPELSNRLRSHGFKTLSGDAVHLGATQEHPEATRNTLAEFLTLRNASRIFQISKYGWGSGFSSTASMLWGIPLVQKRI